MKVAFDLNARLVLRWFLGLILVWAALGKIANLHQFYLDLILYDLPLPDGLLRLSAMVLPWLELLCGLLLFAGSVAQRGALLWSALLFGVFILATGQAWFRGLEITCGCMKLDFLGPQVKAVMESVKFAFFRAIVLLAISLYLLRRTREDSMTVIAA